jgi:hypothetical protein
MNSWLASTRTQDWVCLIAAIGIGPVCLGIGNRIPGLIFGAAAGYVFLYYLFVIPVLTALGGRLKFIIWQVAVFSVLLSVIAEDLPMHASEISSVAFVFWTSGTLLSLPVPAYFFLKPMTMLGRKIWAAVIVTAGIALSFALHRITG